MKSIFAGCALSLDSGWNVLGSAGKAIRGVSGAEKTSLTMKIKVIWYTALAEG